jgi:hypothetical protein
MSPDGQPTKLGDLIIARGKELGAQAAAAEAAAAPPNPAAPAPAGRASTGELTMSIEPQQVRIAMLYQRKLGIADRDQRLADIGHRLGREITTTKGMTFAEAADAIAWLAEQPDYIPDPAAEEPGAQSDRPPDPLPIDPDPALIAELAAAVENAGSVHALNQATMRFGVCRRQLLIDDQVCAELMGLAGERRKAIEATGRAPALAGAGASP